MPGSSTRREDLSEAMYSIIDLDAMALQEEDLPDIDDLRRSPTSSSAPNSRPSSRGRAYRHQARQQKRREQNKAAQRSFRARKEQHLSEIITRIESLELRKKSIEDENQVLMHELLRKRAENNQLRSSRRLSLQVSPSGGGSGDGSSGGGTTTTITRTWTDPSFSQATSLRQPSHIFESPSPSSTRAQGKRPVRDFPGAAEQRSRRSRTLPIESLMWLYAPFLEVWKLIKEQPSVVRGDVKVDEVMDRLKEMARYEDQAAGQVHHPTGATSSTVGDLPRNSEASAIVRATHQRARSL